MENGRTYRLNDNHRWERVESAQATPSTPGVHHTETPEFKAWFGDSKVVDADGKPKVVFHGAKRADRVGNRFRKDRATSGPMQYFSDDPEMASSYSTNKNDTSKERPSDYAQWFKWQPPGSRKPVDIDQAWFHLPFEERDRIKNALYTVGYSDPDEASGPIVAGTESIMSRSSIDYELREARGNALRAAVEMWLSSGTLFNEEDKFLDVLKALGVKGAEIDDPDESRSGVFPVYLDIRNPLDTGDIPEEVYAALEQSSKRKRAKKAAGGDPDAWDKNTIDGPSWYAYLLNDRASGTTHAWTRVPDWATETLEGMGYDGIKDVGGKHGGREHQVWVPFREDQIKSRANRGTWDRSTGNMLMSLRPGMTKVEDGRTYRLNEHHRWERQYDVDVNQTSGQPQNKVVSGLQADPAAISHYRKTDRAIGVSAQPRKLSETVITGIASHANTGNVVFVDSGIASTVSKGLGVEFDKVFDNYHNILSRVQPSHRNKVWVVAPDHLEKTEDGEFRGDQQKTLDLQREHAEAIAEFQNMGATVIVPIQKGKNSLSAAAADATDAIDFSNGRTAFGIPYNKGAWDDESILDLAMNQLGAEAHFHLLGAGKEKVDRLAARIHEINADIRVTGDAATEARNAQWKQNRDSAYRQVLLFSVARMSLRPGMTKVEDGKTYRLNENHRWENIEENPISRKHVVDHFTRQQQSLGAGSHVESHINSTNGRIWEKISKSPWRTMKDLEVKGRGGVSLANVVSRSVTEMKKAGFLTVAWDREGNPHYAVPGAELPSWLTQSEDDADLAKLPPKGHQAQPAAPSSNERGLSMMLRTLSTAATVAGKSVQRKTGKHPHVLSPNEFRDAYDPDGSRWEVGLDVESLHKEWVNAANIYIPDEIHDDALNEYAGNDEPALLQTKNQRYAKRQAEKTQGSVVMALRRSGLSGRAISELGDPDASTVANSRFDAARWVRQEARNTLKFWDEFREFRDKDIAREYRKLLGPQVQRLSLYDPDEDEEDEDEDGDDPEVMSRAEMIAEFLMELYGEDAEQMFDELFSGTITMAIRWDPFQHPRDKNGRFVQKNSPEAVAAARSKIEDALVGGRGHATMRTLVDHLAILTSKQLAELKTDYNIKASAKDKQALMGKIADRLDRGRRKPQPESEKADVHEFNALVDKMLVRHFSPTLVRKIESKDNFLTLGDVTPLDGAKFFRHIKDLATAAGEVDAFYDFAKEAGELFQRQELEVPGNVFRAIGKPTDRDGVLQTAYRDSVFQQMEREKAMQRKKEIDAYHWAVEHVKQPTKHDSKVGSKPEKMEYEQFLFWKGLSLEAKYKRSIKIAERFIKMIGGEGDMLTPNYDNLSEHIAFYKKNKSAIDTIVRAGGPGRSGWRKAWLQDGIAAARRALDKIAENPIDDPNTPPLKRLYDAFNPMLVDEWAMEHEESLKRYVVLERDKGLEGPLTTEQVRKYRYRSWLPDRYNDTKTTLDYIENREKYMASDRHANALKMLKRGIDRALPRLRELYASTIEKDDFLGKSQREYDLLKAKFFDVTSEIIALNDRKKALDATGALDRATVLERDSILVRRKELMEKAEKADRAIADHRIAANKEFMDRLFPVPEPGKNMVDIPYEKAFDGAEIPVTSDDMVNFLTQVSVAKTFLNRLFSSRETPITAQVLTTREIYTQKPSFYPDRASALGNKIFIYPQVRLDALIHEVGHILEAENDSAIAVLAKAFAQQAIADSGQKVDRLPRNNFNSGAYDPHEIGAQAIFGHPYDSKYYPQTASEVTSRGLEYLWSDPIKFLEQSPDHFDFTVAALKGLFK